MGAIDSVEKTCYNNGSEQVLSTVKYGYDNQYRSVTGVTTGADGILLTNAMTYSDGLLKTVTDGLVKYAFDVDGYYGTARFSVYDGDTEEVLQDEAVDGLKASTVYIRGEEKKDEIVTTSDEYGAFTSQTYNGEEKVRCNYCTVNSSSGYARLPDRITDYYSGRETVFEYDDDGNAVGLTQSDVSTNEALFGIKTPNPALTEYTFGDGESYTALTEYDGNLISPRVKATKVITSDREINFIGKNYSYDDLGRINKSNYSYSYSSNISNSAYTELAEKTTTKYTYKSGSSLISKMAYSFTMETSTVNTAPTFANRDVQLTCTYTYDAKGNIESVIESGSSTGSSSVGWSEESIEDIPSYSKSISYTYDNHNRLTREDNELMNINRSYEYADGRLSKTIANGLTTEYSYDKKGRLYSRTVTDSTGYSEYVFYRYDRYGNRIGIAPYEDSIAYTVYEWERGTKLKQIVIHPNFYYSYKYNHDGIRTEKVITTGGIENSVIKYYYNGANLLGEDRIEGDAVNKLRYFYDLQGICGFSYNGKVYSYVKDIFGNVVMLMDSCMPVARYCYDAQGNHRVLNPDGTVNAVATFIGNINPIRYRSYYYDTESNLYYLQSRYYDPVIGQFISPDSKAYLDPMIVGGIDLYAYCRYNPINFVDYTGEDAVVVVEYGLPIVGHVVLYVEDENGTWHKTEYIGDGVVKNHIIEGDVQLDIEKEYSEKGYNKRYIEGDFTGSVAKLKTYDKNESGFGEYNLLFNSCQTYANMILREGTAKDPLVNNYIHSKRAALTAIPAIYQLNLGAHIDASKGIYDWTIVGSIFATALLRDAFRVLAPGVISWIIFGFQIHNTIVNE